MPDKKKTAETLLLKEEEIFPSDDVLKNALGDVYPVFKEFMDTIQSEEHGLRPRWNYYKDGKAWLCKAVYKKKTILWISVGERYFKVSLYFTEKTGAGISQLGIDRRLKKEFASGKPAGKLKPIVMKVIDRQQLTDMYTLIEYKKNIR